MRFTSDWLGGRDAFGFCHVRESENWRFPTFSLLGKIQVLGGLGGDSVLKNDVWEDGVFQSPGNVDSRLLSPGLHFCSLLLSFGQLLLESSKVSVVDVWGISRVAHDLLLSSIDLLLDFEQKAIELMGLVFDHLLKELLESGAKEFQPGLELAAFG